jgi:serine/threonine-protein kinase SMG1
LRSGCEKQKTALIGVYHSLLSLKNIPLLQETYGYLLLNLFPVFLSTTILSISSLVLQDLEKAYKKLVPTLEPIGTISEAKAFKDYSEEEAEVITLFLLNSLIDIGK